MNCQDQNVPTYIKQMKNLKQYHSQIEYVCNELNIGALALFSPKWGFKDMAKVPKTRYTIMREYMPKVGSHGLDMMHCSATTQVNLDYSDENDFTKSSVLRWHFSR
ncbi:MAG: hypothetical protein CM15mP111_3690 [Hyphomicrobiales bacterium]|nr:MAG: hypothetical protein CM15mP111_3690 [Hyphomicrobiales bacterium]